MDQAAALSLVYDAMDAVNGLRREGDRLQKEPGVLLMGEGGQLDSLGLATLLLALERQVEECTGSPIFLLDDLALDMANEMKRFETPLSIAALIQEKVA